jgi:hypothetical protein
MGGSNLVSIQELFPTNELYADVGGDPEVSDQILVYADDVYTPYFYCNFGNEGDPQWYDDTYEIPSAKKFGRGEGFWYLRATASDATTVTVSGQVPTNSSYAHAVLPTGYSIIANAYPNETSLNALGINAYADAGGDPEVSDQILVYVAGVYTPYFFCDFGNEGDPQWYDDTYEIPVSIGLKVGQGAWYLRNNVSSATWTENKPY